MLHPQARHTRRTRSDQQESTGSALTSFGPRLVSAVVAIAALAATLIAGLAIHTSADAATRSDTTANSVRTLTVSPLADSFISSMHGKTRYGKRMRMTVGTTPGDGNIRKSYLRFDIPGSRSVISAHLVLTRFGHWQPQPVSAREVDTTGWAESTIDRYNAPHISTWLDTTDVRRSSRTVTLDVTSAFAHRRKASIAVISPVSRGLAQFASRQAPSLHPVLRVVLGKNLRTPQGPPPTDPTTPTTDPTTPTTDPTTPSTDPTTPTSAPTTPTTDPTTPTSNPTTPTAPSTGCTVSAILVPSCGDWLGIAPEQFESMSLTNALSAEEQVAERPYDIVHMYHVNGQLFPTAEEIAIANQPGENHLLLENWKPSTSLTWAQVAAGGADSTIDAEAAYLKSHFTEPFFLTIYHEPEDNVIPTAGSGMTASDYAAMYRYVVLRLRADGVTNAVTVMNYMGYYRWAHQSWFSQLYPGDDVVDWLGFDPYGSGSTSGGVAHNLSQLVNYANGDFSGYYNWATSQHPGKPIMLCEWGVSYDPSNPTGQAPFFDSISSTASQFPAVHAYVYYDVPTNRTSSGLPWTTVTQNSTVESAYQNMANSAPFDAPAWNYSTGK